MGIELLNKIAKSHVLTVLRPHHKGIWSQMELSRGQLLKDSRKKTVPTALDHRHSNDLSLFSLSGLSEDFFLALVLFLFRRPRLDGRSD